MNCSGFFYKRQPFIDEIILSLRDINSLTRSKMENVCAINNSMVREPNSTQEGTQQVSHILDAKYEKTDIQSVVSANCTHQSLPDQNKSLELLTEYEELFDGTLLYILVHKTHQMSKDTFKNVVYYV